MGFMDVLGGVSQLINAGTNIWSDITNQQSLDWMKQAQQTTWAREDDAVQRRAADLKAAGINPLLAAGQAASSSGPISLPQEHFEGIGNPAQALLDITSQKKNIAQTDAEIQRTKEVTDAQHIENLKNHSMLAIAGAAAHVNDNTVPTEQDGADALANIGLSTLNSNNAAAASVAAAAAADARAKSTNADILTRDLGIAQNRNLPYNATSEAQGIADMSDLFKKNGNGSFLGALISILAKAGPGVVTAAAKGGM